MVFAHSQESNDLAKNWLDTGAFNDCRYLRCTVEIHINTHTIHTCMHTYTYIYIHTSEMGNEPSQTGQHTSALPWIRADGDPTGRYQGFVFGRASPSEIAPLTAQRTHRYITYTYACTTCTHTHTYIHTHINTHCPHTCWKTESAAFPGGAAAIR